MNSAIRHCPECQSPLPANSGRGRPKRYCSVQCGKSFDNRRMVRGAILYDAMMNQRFNRKEADAAGMWNTMCRIATDYREMDAGKITYRDIPSILADVTHLRFTAKVQDMTGRRKRA